MRVIFITFDPLSPESSYLRRLYAELQYLPVYDKVSIISLSTQKESSGVRLFSPSISFFNFPARFIGWEIVNIEEVIAYILKQTTVTKPDLVVITVEYWDLVRELSLKLSGIIPLATIFHAMPFLVAPITPSDDFEKDVKKYAKSGIDTYKERYILKHFREVSGVFSRISTVASNKTTAFYLQNYLPNIQIWTQTPMIFDAEPLQDLQSATGYYDFVYMARIERGKGLEYLSGILERLLGYDSVPLRVAIMGEPQDSSSASSLKELLKRFNTNPYVHIDYLGWANEKTKRRILLNSKVFLYPSCLDNFPTVVNEALTFGLPVVTWNLPFSKLNYSSTESVRRVQFLDLESFAREAHFARQHRDTLSLKALSFIKASYESPAESAKSDTRLFHQIIKKYARS